MSYEYSAGPRLTDDPAGDPRRQAIASLRGYVYQLYASALAWVDLRQGQQLYLEVAEDYATLANQVLQGIQVKYTAQSGSVTINSQDVLDAIDAFVDLIERNPALEVMLRFLSTSEIGRERSAEDRVEGESVLLYWRRAAAGADIAPLRTALTKAKLSERVKKFIDARNDEKLREELLKKIHWDCGRPELAEIKGDLEAMLVEFGSERFQLVPSESRTLPAVVIAKILDTVVGPMPRRLTNADLLKLCEQHTRVSVPKAALNAVMQRLSAAPSGTFFSEQPAPGLLEAEADLAMPTGLAGRQRLVDAARTRLQDEKLLFLTGGTGVGKTMVARLIARSTGKPWYVLDLRDTSASECARRLQNALGQLSDWLPAGLILDDLNEAENHTVAQALERLIRALRRHDAACLATSYRAPTTVLLDRLSASAEAVMAVPHLGEEEVGELVIAAGGDGEVWRTPIYLYGGMGHPQLVRALLAGLRSRGWPTVELPALSTVNEGNPDIEAARSAVRRRLTEVLQDEPRRLLYRASLLIGRFSRSLVLHLAAIAPQVDMPGERLDTLVGPWIDALANGQLRNSPLVANLGRDTLLPGEQAAVRRTALKQLLAGNTLDVRQADAAYLYALEGKLRTELLKFAGAVIGSKEKDIRRLAGWLPSLRGMSTKSPILPDDADVSAALRFAQVLLVAQTNDTYAVLDVWQALEREVRLSLQPALGDRFEFMVLSKVLVSTSLAQMLSDWFSVLKRFDHLSRTSPEWGALVAAAEASAPLLNGHKASLLGSFFVMHATNVKTVKDQVRLFAALDALDSSDRARYLEEASKMPSDYALLVNASWLAEAKNDSLDWARAAQAYSEMAFQAIRWGYRELALRCYVAQAIMLDDYGSQEEAAIQVLAQAEAALGSDPVISRARAKIHFRHKRHLSVLESFGEGAAGFALGDPVERAYMCREMGISAAETGDWLVASEWFGRAREAAFSARSKTMRPMAIGLRADEALAIYLAGEFSRAVTIYGEVLQSLATLDGDGSTKAAYCQRVVRHGLLWMFGQVTGRTLEVDGEPPVMVPGMCSNPEPPESIRDQPCASVDVAWYLQAVIEAQHLGVAAADANLAQRLNGKTMPGLEVIAREEFVASASSRLDVDGFAMQFCPWTDSVVYLAEHFEEFRKSDVTESRHGFIPSASASQLGASLVQQRIEDAIIAFGMFAAMNRQRDRVAALAAGLKDRLGAEAARELLNLMLNGNSTAENLRVFICTAVHITFAHEVLTPEQLFGVTLRFVQATQRSSFSSHLVRRFAPWAREAWQRAVENRFALVNPRVTVPAIQAVLAGGCDHLSAVAALLLVAEDAVSVRLHPSLRGMLRAFSEDGQGKRGLG
jgi:hypothetical protein